MKGNIFLTMWLCLGLGCGPKKYQAIKPTDFMQYPWPKGKRQIEIAIIKSFILDKECDSNRKYADAFLSKVNDSRDTILVFSVCRKTYDFLRPKYKGSLWLVVDSANVDTQYPKEIITNVDRSLDIKNYRIIFAEINNLKD